MPCDHKFIDYLKLERLDFKPTTLIIGTFNPSWPASNNASWFYGRVGNNYFWDILPRMFGKAGLRGKGKTDWIEFCKINLIAITDLIISIQDADILDTKHTQILGKYLDSDIEKKFKTHVPNKIVDLLIAHPTIKCVYLTTTVSKGLWCDLWQPVVDYCDLNKKKCLQLMTPSKGARFFMTKGSGQKMPDFIYDDWKLKWH